MKKEITEDMYNYNKYPGPNFTFDGNVVRSSTSEFLLIENVKDGFKLEPFTQRFSEILLKYDFIVGDWGNEQLRLKGFYHNDKNKIKNTTKITYLDDYVTEYCNFGCAYFVLKNTEPIEPVFEEEKHQKSRHKKEFKRKQFNKKNRTKHDKTKREKAKDQEQALAIRDAKQHFVIRKKEK